MSALKVCPVFSDRDFAALVEAENPEIDLAVWVDENREALERLTTEYPVLLLRGFKVANDFDFVRVRQSLIPTPAEYLYRSTPRSHVDDGVMTATEYPENQEILQHCENAYQRDWPMRLLFCCLVAAQSGGQTSVSDVSRVTQRLDPEIVDEFGKRGICYIRNYHDGFDLDWRVVFQTQSRDAVETFCKANDITTEWIDDNSLRTRQVCQGVANHPVTGELLWFNQAHLFHPSALGNEVMQDMMDIFGTDGLPRYAQFGDDTTIPPDMLSHVRAAFAAETRSFDWQAGDVMIVDNMRAAHGRQPYSGDRRVLVSMGFMYSEMIQNLGES